MSKFVTPIFLMLSLMSLPVLMTMDSKALADPEIPGLKDPNQPELNAIADQLFNDFMGAFPPNPKLMQRPVFAKAHGCLKAQFIVDEKLPAEYRQGVFAGHSYDAWVRFANDSNPTPDTVPDGNPARGMAIKVIGFEKYPKYLEPLAKTQDFIMENNPAFFAEDAKDFLAFVESRGAILKDDSHKAQKAVLDKIQTSPLSDPLAGQYWTPTPYRLGPNLKMKYMAKPCDNQSRKWSDAPEKGPNYLHDNLRVHALTGKGNDLCMNFYVQLYKDDDVTKLDNATKPWSEQVSPMKLAAKVVILPGQDLGVFGKPSPRNRRCESLSFNPWHTSVDHEPLGSLNYVRKIVYAKSAAHRKTYNNGHGQPMPTLEPTDLSE